MRHIFYQEESQGLWNELNVQKRDLYVKKKEPKDMRVLSKPPVRTGLMFSAIT